MLLRRTGINTFPELEIPVILDWSTKGDDLLVAGMRTGRKATEERENT